jgi:hypothetical protein
MFLGYSNMHKGFKCLEISSGQVYVSRDVVFDETEFPFSKLHSNARARLREEISLLPFNLLNPSESEQYGDHVANLTILMHLVKILIKTGLLMYLL